jgi:hypothetical protein
MPTPCAQEGDVNFIRWLIGSRRRTRLEARSPASNLPTHGKKGKVSTKEREDGQAAGKTDCDGVALGYS